MTVRNGLIHLVEDDAAAMRVRLRERRVLLTIPGQLATRKDYRV